MEVYQTDLFMQMQEYGVSTVDDLVKITEDEDTAFPEALLLQKHFLHEIECGNICVIKEHDTWTLQSTTTETKKYDMWIVPQNHLCVDRSNRHNYFGEIETFGPYMSFVSNGECVAIWKDV